MATNFDVKCNFTTLFSQFSNVEDLKAIANSICGQVKTAFDARVAEIKAAKPLSVEVEVSAPAAPAPTQAPTAKAKGKTAAAKEAAARMKEEAKVEKAKTKKTKAKAENASATEEVDQISVTDMAAIKKLGLTFEKYNDRCWVLRGNTKPLRKVLKDQFKGVFNSFLTGGEGWVFNNTKAQGVADALGIKVKVA